METLVNYILCLSEYALFFVPEYLYIHTTRLVGRYAHSNDEITDQKPVCGLYSVISSLEWPYCSLYLHNIVR